MQINSIQQANKTAFGNLKIDDKRIRKNLQWVIEYETQKEVKNLDDLGFDVIIKPEACSLLETSNSDVFLKRKTDNEKLHIATLYRGNQVAFVNSLDAVKKTLSELSSKN